MSVSTDYPRPVAVNGSLCWNCHQVAEAKKGVDPAKPSDEADRVGSASSPAFQLGGVLQRLANASAPSDARVASARALDILA